MKYVDGSQVSLGDIVNVPVPTGTAQARVVMLGDTYEHLEIDPDFVAWVKSEHLLDERSGVVEWIGPNPLAHEDPRYAPAGNYMFTPIDEWVKHEG
jgi:hypothetical protein